MQRISPWSDATNTTYWLAHNERRTNFARESKLLGDGCGLLKRIDWQPDLNHLTEKLCHPSFARNRGGDFVHPTSKTIADAAHIFGALLHIER